MVTITMQQFAEILHLHLKDNHRMRDVVVGMSLKRLTINIVGGFSIDVMFKGSDCIEEKLEIG